MSEQANIAIPAFAKIAAETATEIVANSHLSYDATAHAWELVFTATMTAMIEAANVNGAMQQQLSHVEAHLEQQRRDILERLTSVEDLVRSVCMNGGRANETTIIT